MFQIRKFLGNLLRFIKMPVSFDFLKIKLLAYFDRLTWTLLSKSLIFWLSLLLSSVTRLVYQTTRMYRDRFQFNWYFISKSSNFTFIPKTKFHFSVSKQKLKNSQHYAKDILP